MSNVGHASGTVVLAGEKADGTLERIRTDDSGGAKVTLNTAIAGERNTSSDTNSYLVAHSEANYTLVDASVDSTTVSSVPALLLGIYVDTVLSAHALPIKDAAATIFSLPSLTAVGAFDFGSNGSGIRFETSLVVDPDNAATGKIVVFWRAI